jgi:hypothetical protein
MLNFKQFYLKEDELDGRIKMLVYGNNFVFFFIFEGNVYGGNEEARLSYATMREDSEDGSEEMVFEAKNLFLDKENFFTIRDINNIHVISNKKAEILLHRYYGAK